MFYPFNFGDLRDSYHVLVKNLENNASGRIPWDDLKYIFGEIMYGGHIVDDWDRRLCAAYLENIMAPNICTDEFELIPYADGSGYSFKTTLAVSFDKFIEHIDSNLPTNENPIYYGLHPNADIALGNAQCEYLFNSLVDILPKENIQSDQGGKVRLDEMYISKIINDINIKDKVFNLLDIKDRISEKGPYQNVFLQECEYMNYLIEEIARSLLELEQGLKGNLTISE